MDFWLESGDMYYFLTKKRFPKVGRFLYRAYEIALFSSKYYDEISWIDIQNDILNQKLRLVFKKMILDITDIFVDIFPQSLMETVLVIDYVDDDRDQLYKYLMETKVEQNDENIEDILCRYIEENWLIHKENNISKTNAETAFTPHFPPIPLCWITMRYRRETVSGNTRRSEIWRWSRWTQNHLTSGTPPHLREGSAKKP